MADSLSSAHILDGAARQSAAPQEPRLPRGRLLENVQPHPVPLVTAPPPAQPQPDEASARAHAAGQRSELSGTGGIVDLYV